MSTSQAVTVSVPAPAISVNPTSLTFLTAVNSSSSFQDITVTNTGAATLNIPSIVKAGAAYTASTSCATTLAAGASCNIRITFSTDGNHQVLRWHNPARNRNPKRNRRRHLQRNRAHQWHSRVQRGA